MTSIELSFLATSSTPGQQGLCYCCYYQYHDLLDPENVVLHSDKEVIWWDAFLSKISVYF